MAKGPFKMKANPEGPMRKNFPSVFKNNKKKKTSETSEITEHVLFKDPAISSVEHSKTTYSPKSGLQISGHGSKTHDVITKPDGTTYKNLWKKSGKKRSAEYILNNPNG